MERRVLQFVRPDEQIVPLDPGDYELIVGHKFWNKPACGVPLGGGSLTVECTFTTRAS